MPYSVDMTMKSVLDQLQNEAKKTKIYNAEQIIEDNKTDVCRVKDILVSLRLLHLTLSNNKKLLLMGSKSVGLELNKRMLVKLANELLDLAETMSD